MGHTIIHFPRKLSFLKRVLYILASLDGDEDYNGGPYISWALNKYWLTTSMKKAPSPSNFYKIRELSNLTLTT